MIVLSERTGVGQERNTVILFTPNMRQVGAMLLPSTRAVRIWARFSVVNFLMHASYT